jgi:hypothetical protein
MTSSRAWKQAEQWWAELHGESRSGPTGRDMPDATSENWPVGIEVKFQTKRCLRSDDIAQARENAAKLKLPWTLVLHEKGTDRVDDLVIMPVSTYLGIITKHIKPEHGLPPSTHELARELLGQPPVSWKGLPG